MKVATRPTTVLLLLLAAACGGDDDPADAVDAAVPVVDAGASIDAEPTPEYTLIAADRAGDLFRVNLTTGAATSLLDTSTIDEMSASVDVGVISGMQWIDSKSELWAGTGGNATFNAAIMVVNTTTGELTTLTDLSDTGTSGIPGLTFRPSDRLVYTLTGDGSGIRTIDPADADFVDVGGATGGTGNGLAFAADETLYVVDRHTLEVANPADGSIITMTDLSYVGFPAFVGSSQPIHTIAFHPNDRVLYGLLQDGAGTDERTNCYLVTIDTATATATNVGVVGQELDGLAFVPVSVFP